ncbi:glutamine synthetase family protein [Ketogulonicigenium vulgare]|uniref:Glutamine synthetase family protein n=1 Tax=Ketogulonicigenium vulgare (strain WSH-001) TaxID=759362 RepID=F9Y9E8_KETVW|nr:glutamine synthetase family protein [Ketogulonicigenium vulgare]ADO41906.1 glutamine synthetase family protein [Ketogulonicigenium vulgare Y25]AEM40130.1 Glutamine synthetase family protein [Ketogulonicigenium vulgare WSH-001]ALJ80336.1 glutamine synthetase [Ketogulonicigenium vulgare]ANW33173.1 glutamine synthetase [Ketogulonicigenium vulgare]AOZ53829.1 glutamine synthetase, catalytic domain, putative [Ketogulonicigenium vulgare]
MSWTDQIPQAARDYLEANKLDEVECVIADFPGIARGKAVPAMKWERQQYFHLPNSIFFQTITGEWAEAAGPEGYVEPDMVLRPDLSTASAAPWAKDGTLQVIHDAFDQKGNPVACSPRNVLKRVVALYKARGWTPVVAPEMEFYLVARNTDPAKAISPMMGRTGRPAAARQAYSMTAVDEYGPVIDDIYEFAEVQGIEIDGITQEGGAGQIEINLRHGDPVKLADEIFYFKRLIREAALKNDCYATFMAKPIEGEPGSAMHIHHSIIDLQGRNLFNGPHGGETDLFFHFIGGLQEHMPAAIAVMAPYVNSYRRYVRNFAAPINLEWGRDNRTTGIRIPISPPEARRIENRLAGMDCNPYLAIAASLACGYLGMVNEIWPEKRYHGDAGDAEGEDIPTSLGDAMDLFDESKALHEVMGPDFARVYSIVKHTEYDEFLQVISPWEREHLLLNV